MRSRGIALTMASLAAPAPPTALGSFKFAEGAGGDCLEASVNFLVLRGPPTRLVSGDVTVEGRQIRHVWVEDGPWAYEMSRGQELQIDVTAYRATMKAANVHSLGYEAVAKLLRDNMDDTGTVTAEPLWKALNQKPRRWRR